MKRYIYLIPLSLSLIILDLIVRYNNINIFGIFINNYNISYISLIISIILIFNEIRGKLLYLSIILFYALILLIYYFHLNVISPLFNLINSLLTLDIIKYFINVNTLIFIIDLILISLTIKLFPKDKQKSDLFIGLILMIVSISVMLL